MDVYVGREKHSNPVYASALAAVRHRIEEFYQYEDDGSEELAREVLASGDEGRAWGFLQHRDDYEYEGIERVTVIE